MELLLWIIGFSILGSIACMIGGFFLLWKEKLAKKISLALVSFAAGVLLTAAFLELIPESIELVHIHDAMFAVLAGIAFVFVVERLFIWHHCHKGEKCQVHLPSYMILIGDSVHNFIDGLIITASFFVSIPLGIMTSLAVISHEIPQEIGDFGVMLHGGWKKKKIIIYNLLAATMTIWGAIIAYFALPFFDGIEGYLIAFAAGTFIYIAGTDLIPETHREKAPAKNLMSLTAFFLGILVFWTIGKMLGH